MINSLKEAFNFYHLKKHAIFPPVLLCQQGLTTFYHDNLLETGQIKNLGGDKMKGSFFSLVNLPIWPVS